MIPFHRSRLGEAYEKQGAWDKASAAFEQAAKLNPNLASTVTKLAQLNAGPLQNKEKLSLTRRKRANSRQPIPKSPPFLERSPTKAAISAGLTAFCRKLLVNAQNDPSVLRDLAWAAYSLGKVNEARDAMQKVVASGSNSAAGCRC